MTRWKAPATKHLKRGAAWLVGAVLAAVIGFGVTIVLTGTFSSSSATTAKEAKTDRGSVPRPAVLASGERAEAGYGPSRPTFRCAHPNRCDGPHYVTFDSYFNNPTVGDERPFLSAQVPAGSGAPVVDTVTLDGRPTELLLRAYIDNDTFQELQELATTDALDTHLRLALPARPVYEANPTAYLEAGNAKPRSIWDTITVRSLARPARLAYVPDSTTLTVEDESGHTVTRSLDDGLQNPAGLDLGSWKADFRYSGYVTFRVSAIPAPEPVRDPRLTRAIGDSVIYAPVTEDGPAAEPMRDGEWGDRFSCTATACNGPPFAELNAYRDHPLLGDEADFVRGALASDYVDKGTETYRTVALVRPGDQLKVRVGIDNGGDPGAIGAPSPAGLTARKVRARVMLPSGAGRELSVAAFLDSANTRPRTISDTLPVRSRTPIRLVLRPVTAAVISAGELRPAPRSLFSIGGLPPTSHRWGMTIGNVPPSFSRVSYVEFYLRVTTARR